jgi:hypothetical protein
MMASTRFGLDYGMILKNRLIIKTDDDSKHEVA